MSCVYGVPLVSYASITSLSLRSGSVRNLETNGTDKESERSVMEGGTAHTPYIRSHASPYIRRVAHECSE